MHARLCGAQEVEAWVPEEVSFEGLASHNEAQVFPGRGVPQRGWCQIGFVLPLTEYVCLQEDEAQFVVVLYAEGGAEEGACNFIHW